MQATTILVHDFIRNPTMFHIILITSKQKTPSPQVEPGCGRVSAELQEDAQTCHHSLHCVAKVSRNCGEVVYVYVPLNQFRYL